MSLVSEMSSRLWWKLLPPTLGCAGTTQTLGLVSLLCCRRDARLRGVTETINGAAGRRLLPSAWPGSVPTLPTATDEASEQQKDPLQDSSKLSHLDRVPVILPPCSSHKHHLFAAPTRATKKGVKRGWFTFVCSSPTLLFSFFIEKMMQMILEQSLINRSKPSRIFE